MKKGIIAIIQARMSSTRLPGKVMLHLRDNELVIDSVYSRIKKSKFIDKVVIATSIHESDDNLVEYCKKRRYIVERGSLEDVLSRYYDVAKKYKKEIIVRVTADNPLVDTILTDELIKFFLEGNFDYVSIRKDDIGIGLGTEVFNFKSLEKAYLQAQGIHREHVTSYLYSKPNIFNCSFINPPEIYKKTKSYRLTLDTKEDYSVIKSIFESYNTNYITVENIISFFNDNPSIARINAEIIQKSVLDK